ncbi:hypothetical protein CKAN_01290500 [Cinnamomum micranthum f. kanehirae]|uniref:Uncharacterized protein n=1 Tax=Cinnamomum micranthum f. kanehirae TaxID=337451 RepID=A0A3S3MX07_9MAGN|nr:hypothetical protein CKAN_01290500 [Cinnamomum micranthum f. kanehirae]
MTFTATCCPFSSPFLNLAEHVYPKCPRPTSPPSSYLLAKFFENPKLLSSPAPPPSASFPCTIAASFGFTDPCLLANTARMCFAGDGGGKGRRKNLLGVELVLAFGAGDFFEKNRAGLGLASSLVPSPLTSWVTPVSKFTRDTGFCKSFFPISTRSSKFSLVETSTDEVFPTKFQSNELEDKLELLKY